MDNDKKPMPSDYVDSVRVQLNKLSKLAPYLDAWVYAEEEKGKYPALDSLANSDTLEAARAAVSGAFQLRKELFNIEHLAQQIVESREQQQNRRMTQFFGPDPEDGE